MYTSSFKNLPNLLTTIRLIVSVILPFFIVYLLPLNIFITNILVSFLFTFFSLTDFFDGYLARKYKLETKLGKALDPVADKFFIIFPLIALLAIKKIYFLWVIIFVGRELFMMGLRQIALENNFNITVSFFGKIKTTFQVLMLSLIIANPYSDKGIFYSYWNKLEFILILFSIFLSLLSAYKYFLSFKARFFNI